MDTWIYREVLDVRCDMAMSRVLKSVDAAQSQRLEDEAVERVYVIALVLACRGGGAGDVHG
jgi:hypothetical protein